MSKIILKRIIIPPGNLRRVFSGTSSGGETAGGVPLDPKRKRQDFAEALRETIARNRGALLKLARR
jgi:hypothetical protein